MKRQAARWMARLLVGALVFAQLAVAAYACPALSPTHAPAKAPAMAGDMDVDDIAPPGAQAADCGGMVGPIDPSSANLCAEHCKQGQQSDKVAALNLLAAVHRPLYVLPPPPDVAPPACPAAGTASALVAASPPHAILHCVYRI